MHLPICKRKSYRTLRAPKTDVIQDVRLLKRQVALYFIPTRLAVRTSLHLISRLFRQALHNARVAVDHAALCTLGYILDNQFLTDKATHVDRYS